MQPTYTEKPHLGLLRPSCATGTPLVFIRDAAGLADAQVAAVRDDPMARLKLLVSMYAEPRGLAPRHPRFRHAALSFMRWEINRGVLNAADGSPPGSPWWRAMNERLLRDGCEAAARAAGLSGTASTPTVTPWLSFIGQPTAPNWYRAHNSSIVAAYLDHLELARLELRAERFFLNVVLLRVLYAHALVAAPRLALGRLAPLGSALGDPRMGMASIFLSLGRVLPERYPLTSDLEHYLRDERGVGRTLDYAVIRPRLQDLYEWSAQELEEPRLADLIGDGKPRYAWSATERHVWEETPTMPAVSRLLGAATGLRRRPPSYR
jgi:hypothetical protein